jgi:hypothetical protein
VDGYFGGIRREIDLFPQMGCNTPVGVPMMAKTEKIKFRVAPTLKASVQGILAEAALDNAL